MQDSLFREVSKMILVLGKEKAVVTTLGLLSFPELIARGPRFGPCGLCRKMISSLGRRDLQFWAYLKCV